MANEVRGLFMYNTLLKKLIKLYTFLKTVSANLRQLFWSFKHNMLFTVKLRGHHTVLRHLMSHIY